ncbi:MAG: DUF167 domain-containing protein [Betaproteobacteria bacterium]|nr:DUF167 domain-containing protein [Betaproteobacteria bacterium]
MTTHAPAGFQASGEGTLLRITAVPNARTTQCEGDFGDTQRVRLRAVPADGQANEVLLAWVAQRLALPQSRVRLMRGASQKRKVLHIDWPFDDVIKRWNA